MSKTLLLIASIFVIINVSCSNVLSNKNKSKYNAEIINGKWELVNVTSGQQINIISFGTSLPNLVFDVDQKRFSGFDGCNNIHGSLFVSKNELKFIEPFAVTKKMCLNNSGDEFIKMMNLIQYFKNENDSILILSDQYSDLLYFNKIYP